ncbi:MAG: hypothetical protein F4041_04425, partial [Acidobacteriia bacterium]|nr:hypothetical protein [Terriglobia bacterium]
MALAGGRESSASAPDPTKHAALNAGRLASFLRLGLGFLWIVFQIYIIFRPQAPQVERPLHLALATTLLFLWFPLNARRLGRFSGVLHVVIVGAALSAGAYYLLSARRLTERMEGVDPVLPVDIFFGALVVLLLLEGVRRVVGWSLLGVLIASLAYAMLGQWTPG